MIKNLLVFSVFFVCTRGSFRWMLCRTAVSDIVEEGTRSENNKKMDLQMPSKQLIDWCKGNGEPTENEEYAVGYDLQIEEENGLPVVVENSPQVQFVDEEVNVISLKRSKVGGRSFTPSTVDSMTDSSSSKSREKIMSSPWGSFEDFCADVTKMDAEFEHTAPIVADLWGLEEVESTSRWQRMIGRKSTVQSRRPMYVSELTERDRSNSNFLRIRRLIAHTATSSVFSTGYTNQMNGLVVKYQSNCETPRGEKHPILKEFYFLKKVEYLGVTPKAYWFSAPSRHPSGRSSKIGFEMSNARMKVCHDVGAQIRFLVMEETGPDISFGPVSIQWALHYGFAMISILKKLHKAGVVHGDIHSGNFVQQLGNPHKLLLIDFERGLQNTVEQASPSRKPFFHALASPWEMMGYEPSYRDDVFRALEVVIGLAAGPSYMETLKRMETLKSDQLIPYKLNYAFSTDEFGKVAETLNEILNVVRTPEFMPHYDEILGLFRKALTKATA